MTKEKITKSITIFIIIIFFIVYFLSSTGIYEYKLEKRKTLTEESIKRFEEDVKNGNVLDVSNYIVKDKNYDNNFSIINRKISNIVADGFSNVIKYITKYMNNL